MVPALTATATAPSHAAPSPPPREPELWRLARRLRRRHRWVDLTHAFHPGQPRFAALPDERRETLFTVPETGFHVERHSIVGQWGTHVDPPVHFVPGARTLDRIEVSESILPLAVLDLHREAAADPDLTVGEAHLRRWEERNGRIPEGSFVALRTDWSLRWETNELTGLDGRGRRHSPGWSIPALRFLREERGVTAIGHETLDTDPGRSVDAGDFGCERWWLERDAWQIELLANLHRVPETGALAVATWPKPRGGTGFPARVLAVLPAGDDAGDDGVGEPR